MSVFYFIFFLSKVGLSIQLGRCLILLKTKIQTFVSLSDDIFQAIEEENIASCKSLIKSLPDINGLHPDLHIGVIHASSTIPCTKFARDLFRTLVKWNVDVNALTGEGYSPLDIAVSNDRLETTKFLLKHGAQPSDR